MGDFVVQSDQDDNVMKPQPDLQRALDALNVEVSAVNLYAKYFELTWTGMGDVHVFQSAAKPTNVLAIDMHRGLTEQLDCVSLGVRCKSAFLPEVRDALRAFFDSASCQIAYGEGNFLPKFHEMTDPSRYPHHISESSYMQRRHLYVMGELVPDPIERDAQVQTAQLDIAVTAARPGNQIARAARAVKSVLFEFSVVAAAIAFCYWFFG